MAKSWRTQKTCGHSASSERPSADEGVKNSKKVIKLPFWKKNICKIRITVRWQNSHAHEQTQKQIHKCIHIERHVHIYAHTHTHTHIHTCYNGNTSVARIIWQMTRHYKRKGRFFVLVISFYSSQLVRSCVLVLQRNSILVHIQGNDESSCQLVQNLTSLNNRLKSESYG